MQGSEEEEEKKEDNPLRRCVRRCRRKRMTLRRNFQSLTFLPDVFVRFFIERSRHSSATNTTVITSLKEASVNEVPEQLEDDVAVYSVMSEVNLLPPPSLLTATSLPSSTAATATTSTSFAIRSCHGS